LQAGEFTTPGRFQRENAKAANGKMVFRTAGDLPCGMSDFKKLTVWRKAHGLTLNVHRIATTIRGADNAALRNQILRAAMSIPANIVEGTGQASGAEFGRFLSIAIRSASELEYHLILGHSIRVISTTEFESLSSQTIEVRKMLYSLRNRGVGARRLTGGNVPT
jgi:four helix bundle protein